MFHRYWNFFLYKKNLKGFSPLWLIMINDKTAQCHCIWTAAAAYKISNSFFFVLFLNAMALFFLIIIHNKSYSQLRFLWTRLFMNSGSYELFLRSPSNSLSPVIENTPVFMNSGFYELRLLWTFFPVPLSVYLCYLLRFLWTFHKIASWCETQKKSK